MFARLRLAAVVIAVLSYAGTAAAQAPVITNLSQHSGNPGASVVLTGANFTGTLSVTFGPGATSASFVVNLPTQITATVPAGASPGVISVTNGSGTGTSPIPFYPGPVPTTVVGPVYPPPLGHTFVPSGAPDDGEISRAAGKTFLVSNVPLANTRLVSFGPQPDGVRLAFKNADVDPPGPADILTFQPGLSNLPSGVAVWAGQTSFDSGQAVFTRFTMTVTDTGTGQPVPLVAATAIGLAPTIGALHGILPGQAFRAHHRFDASLTNGSGYQPALVLFDSYLGAKTSARSSYSFGYYYDNLPPRLTVNTGLLLAQGGTAPVSTARLRAVDLDGADSQITFTVGATATSHGTLFKSGTPVLSGGTFTQQDINDGFMSYTHDNSCNTSDLFLFGAVDALGAVMSDAGFTVFNFNIAVTLNNLPPVATNASLSVGPGGSKSSTLTATNSDCITPTYTFTMLVFPTKGTITAFNGSTGAFTYTAAAGQSGPDSFTFRVNDGVHDSVAPGTISITIENQPPVVTPQTLITPEDTAVSGTVAASDSDLPAQPITLRIGTNGAKGTAVLTGASFTYTPAAGRFGADSFTVIANDGQIDSAPATFRVDVTPVLRVGRVLVNSEDLVLLVNPVNSDLGRVAQSSSFSELRGVTHGTSGTVVVNVGDASLYRVDGGVVLLGAVDPSDPIGPVGIATESNGDFLVAQATAGVGRYSPSGTPLTGYTGGFLEVVIDVALAANGDVYVADSGAFVDRPNKIVKIARASGVQTVVAEGGVLDERGILLGLVVDANGDVYATHGSFGDPGGDVFKVTPAGVVTTLTTGDLLDGPVGITFGAPNELIVANGNNASLLKVDKTSGVQTVLYSGKPLVAPWGVRRIASLSLPGALDYFTLPPCRVVDTRGGAPIGGPILQGQQTRTFAVAGNCGIPPTAKAISINLAVTQPSSAGNVRLFAAGLAVPTVSSINYGAGQTRGNNAIISLDATGAMAGFVGQPAGSTVHLILDVNGYFE